MRTQQGRTPRQESAARTHDALIAAGLRLAERTSLVDLSVNLIVAEAGVSKGTFFHHFADRAGYLLAIHRGFHDRLDQQMALAIDGLPPGRERLVTAATVYLDTCLKHRGVRALLLEARAEPVIAEAIKERNRATAARCAPDFTALGWPQPRAGAELWVRLVAEAALLELQAPRRRAATRAALWHYLPGVGPLVRAPSAPRRRPSH